jgi:outer membrane protein assembly factor BamB
VTQLAAEGGRVFAATGPYGFGEAGSGIDFRPVFKSGLQNPGIAVKFRGALAAGAGHVYYAHADGVMSCFEGGAEKTAWTFSAQGFTSPLLVHGGRVWLAAGGRGLYGLNAKTGAVEWSVEPVPDASAFTPFLWDGKPAFWSSDGWLVTTE